MTGERSARARTRGKNLLVKNIYKEIVRNFSGNMEKVSFLGLNFFKAPSHLYK